MTAPKVAAVTMAYNEAALLPVWAGHYARQVGADHCYVIDHGSTETLTLPPGLNVLRLPRSAHDDARRAAFVSQFAATLLHYYDWVIHTDVDELALADPAHFPHLQAYCQAAAIPTVTAVGLELQHVPATEPPLDPARPIGPQRSWVRFSSAICKPVLTRQPLTWAPGFHTASCQLRFDRLYLVHLHWADRDIGLQRLAKTRLMPWADDRFGAHQRLADAEWRRLFDGMAALPQAHDMDLDPARPPLQPWLARVQASAAGQLDLHLNSPELWPLPPRFRDRL